MAKLVDGSQERDLHLQSGHAILNLHRHNRSVAALGVSYRALNHYGTLQNGLSATDEDGEIIRSQVGNLVCYANRSSVEQLVSSLGS